jgi:hypothetical protein
MFDASSIIVLCRDLAGVHELLISIRLAAQPLVLVAA